MATVEDEIRWYWSPRSLVRDLKQLPRGERGKEIAEQRGILEDILIVANSAYHVVLPLAIGSGIGIAVYKGIEYFTK